ncbi:MAG: hypothetical protein IT423_15060 [Pirellulaceae bacterium]|nr:hypothetical protein [Pirellulaceae bacterium]
MRLPFASKRPIGTVTGVAQVQLQDDAQFNADLTQVLGYLNFSSGKPDPKTLSALNRLYGRAVPRTPFEGLPAYLQIYQWLGDMLAKLPAINPAFTQCAQATATLELVWMEFLPAYLDFHRDLLFHQQGEGLFNGFFLGRAIEAVLAQGGPWHENDRIVSGALELLNDFVGHRPVAVLEGRRLEPYPHEWSRPMPLYIVSAGVTTGPYHQVISSALEILRHCDPSLLQRAHFDLAMLDELALDMRAYDFDHPVNRRPNYHFGQWDPNLIDGSGYYRRFVIQQVTLDALLARAAEETSAPREELVLEAAAVLAGTMLMGSGISGSGPSTFPSTTTLVSLMAPIAQFRDEFYEQFLETLQGPHAQRLLEEQKIRRQPFGGARQHLNTYLARQRASQLEHMQVARLFARMGHAQAAREQSDYVSVPSARLIATIDCLLTTGNHALQAGRLDDAAAVIPQIMDWVHRAVGCGALVDPWNILGFAGNFARFHGPDSAVHDHRVGDLVALMEHIFALQSRIWREASGIGREDLCQETKRIFRENAEWWRQFAAHEVSDVNATDPKETFESAKLVAKALSLWNEGGSSAGAVGFWKPHAELFDSPKAFALVVESLLDRFDFVASMSLLIQWLSEAERVGLQSGGASFSDLARQWLQRLETKLSEQAELPDQTENSATSKLDWSMAQKFIDFMESNAGHFLKPPSFMLSSNQRRPAKPDQPPLHGDEDDPEYDGKLLEAAWDGVSYKDTTNDGIESETAEEGSDNQDELQSESNRLGQHLTFLSAMAQIYKTAALSPHVRRQIDQGGPKAERCLESLEQWSHQAAESRLGLLELLNEVTGYAIGQAGSDIDAMSRYDRQRLLKESLLERILSTVVETADARRMLLAALHSSDLTCEEVHREIESLPDDDRMAVQIFGYLLKGDAAQVEQHFPELLEALRPKCLLYIPLARGGDPSQIYAVRLRRRVLSQLLVWLPRQGLFYSVCQLIETARSMEHKNSVGNGAITEFDDMFKLAYKAMVRAVVKNAYAWRIEELKQDPSVDPSTLQMPDLDKHDGDSLGDLEPGGEELIIVLQQLTEVLLNSWLQHSRTLRLSVLETVDNTKSWRQVVDFIQRYGAPLFTQNFLKLTNVRAILHQGVDRWLTKVIEEGTSEEVQPLVDAIDAHVIERETAEQLLTVVLEAIIDHNAEYRDYNSTTTQSDRGEMLYMLLDFLRLRVRYDRVCWNLRPIFWTHEVLVRGGCHVSALQWRRALAERIGSEADMYLEHLAKLQAKYAMRMPTVADRLQERFTRPMTIDRMKALVGPAIRHFRATGLPNDSFDLLIEECKLMMEQPTGVGLDVPQWLAALEDEVDQVLEFQRGFTQRPQYEGAVAYRFVTVAEIVDQLNSASKDL